MAWAHTQSILGVDGSGTAALTVALAFAAPVSNNGLVVGMVSWGDATITCTAVDDDKGNTYTRQDAKANPGQGQSAVQFYKEGITNAPQTITAHFSLTVGFRRMVLGEYSGIATSAAIDGHNSQVQDGPNNNVASLNSLNSLAAVTVSDGDLIWGATVDSTGSGNTLSAGTSPNAFTSRANGTSADSVDMMCEEFLQVTHGSIAATAGNTVGTDSFTTFVQAFKIAAAAPVATVPLGILGFVENEF